MTRPRLGLSKANVDAVGREQAEALKEVNKELMKMNGLTLRLTPMASSTIDNIKKEFERRGMTEAIEVVERVELEDRLAAQSLSEICMGCGQHMRMHDCEWKSKYFDFLTKRNEFAPPGTTRTDEQEG